MFCTSCGAAIESDATFCTSCGAATLAAPHDNDKPVVASGNGAAKNGISKCPHCGSSDIELNIVSGLLHCNYCHQEFSAPANDLDGDIRELTSVKIGSAAQDIIPDAADILTLKCSACGAEVVIDTKEAPQARCHWCRNALSLNEAVPNGAVPDVVLPFRLTREQACASIEAFVKKRRFFANTQFKQEFKTDNVMGVYLPYMVVDVNAKMAMRGSGEHLVRKYTVGDGKNQETRYDADLYAVSREFDLLIDDLTLEASDSRLDQNSSRNTNNIINTILPFPLEDAVKFDANYLRGFSSEKRDVNREQLANLVNAQSCDIARARARETTAFYDRGIRWDEELLATKGQLWKTAYLPVWLYSYMQTKSNGSNLLHYVAVNGTTGETMGSIPVHIPKLLIVSAIVEAVGLAVGALLLLAYFFMA
jgi:hypothetical protein